MNYYTLSNHSNKVRSLPTVTFSHITIQTAYNKNLVNFCPDGHVLQIARRCTSTGFHDCGNLWPGLALDLSEFTATDAVFGIYHDQGLLSMNHALFHAKDANLVWTHIAARVKKSSWLEMRNRFGPVLGSSYSAMLQFPEWRQPPDGLFLASLLGPGLLANPTATLWLGDFEAAVYWALWNKNQNLLASKSDNTAA